MSKSETTPARHITRFAHPFFTTTPPAERAAMAGATGGMTHMTQHVAQHLELVPAVRGNSTMTLHDVIGDITDIVNEGAITFHAVGDTGHANGRPQELVAAAMTKDYDISTPAKSPAFFLHLGDVNYYDNTSRGYHAQFYQPYKSYPGKIVAIPGNHDGELFRFDGRPTGQTKTLEAFQANFCQTGAASDITSGTILRHMVSQPGVYWRLNAPFVDILGLYSNVAENPGFLKSADIGDKQTKWLTATLKAIATERGTGTRKALLIAVHHPPYSNGSHGGSLDMLSDIDSSCRTAGVWPDAVLAAHSHDYQRYTRYVQVGGGAEMEVPYIVAGGGGRGLSPSLKQATGDRDGDVRYDKSLLDYGYLLVKAAKDSLSFKFFQVNGNDGTVTKFDSVFVNLRTNKLQ